MGSGWAKGGMISEKRYLSLAYQLQGCLCEEGVGFVERQPKINQAAQRGAGKVFLFIFSCLEKVPKELIIPAPNSPLHKKK